jgi:hypothetical protein
MSRNGSIVLNYHKNGSSVQAYVFMNVNVSWPSIIIRMAINNAYSNMYVPKLKKFSQNSTKSLRSLPQHLPAVYICLSSTYGTYIYTYIHDKFSRNSTRSLRSLPQRLSRSSQPDTWCTPLLLDSSTGLLHTDGAHTHT